MARLGFSVGALALTGCSLLVPLDEYGTSSNSGSGGASQGGSSPSGGGGSAALGGGGSGPALCPDGEALGADSNCGVCGHDCLETTCENGECKALPFFTNNDIVFLDIAFKQVSPPNLYIAATDAALDTYYVARFNTLDPSPTQWDIDFGWYILAPSIVYRLLVSGTFLHFNDASGVARIDTTQPAPADLSSVRIAGVPGVTGYADLSLNGTAMYRAAMPDDRIDAFLVSGGLVGAPLATTTPWDLVALSNRIYWTSRTDPGGVQYVAGAAPVTVQSGGVPAGMTLAGSYIYWARCRDGEIWRLDVSQPGLEPELVASGQSAPFFIAAQASDVYWINLNQDECDEPQLLLLEAAIQEGSADLVRGQSDGSGATLVLRSGLHAPTSLAISGDFIYVAQNPATGGELLRVAR